MATYYLTEMNSIKLENSLLKFILNEHLEPIIINGVVSKIISMMYNEGIDYFYSDNLASSANVPVKFVDNIYLHNQSKYYNDSLITLLGTVKDCTIAPNHVQNFEHEVSQILETKKKINTKKNNFKKTNGGRL